MALDLCFVEAPACTSNGSTQRPAIKQHLKYRCFAEDYRGKLFTRDSAALLCGGARV